MHGQWTFNHDTYVQRSLSVYKGKFEFFSIIPGTWWFLAGGLLTRVTWHDSVVGLGLSGWPRATLVKLVEVNAIMISYPTHLLVYQVYKHVVCCPSRYQVVPGKHLLVPSTLQSQV